MQSLIKEHFDNGNNKHIDKHEYNYENGNNKHIDKHEYDYENNCLYYSKDDFYYFLLYLILGIIAAILSWRCNEQANYPFLVKLGCALNAFGFGIFYIIFYVIYYAMNKNDSCTKGYYVSFIDHEKDMPQLTKLYEEFKAAATKAAETATKAVETTTSATSP